MGQPERAGREVVFLAPLWQPFTSTSTSRAQHYWARSNEHRDDTIVSRLEAGVTNRRQPLQLKYTKSGENREQWVALQPGT